MYIDTVDIFAGGTGTYQLYIIGAHFPSTISARTNFKRNLGVFQLGLKGGSLFN